MTGAARPSLSPWSWPVMVAALGYFVDIYDIVIFGVVRKPSLSELGIAREQLDAIGSAIFSWQMWGMLLGGLLWGVLGDRLGRVQALWGSIVLYSLANLACAGLGFYGWSGLAIADQYALLRFVAGIGLAGELGAAITLVSELVTPSRRGLATALVAGIGVAGAVAAVAVSKLVDWRTAYVVGGVMGFALLGLRMRVLESGLFAHSRALGARRGDLLLLLGSADRLRRLAASILIGVPTWFTVGVLVFFMNKLALAKQPGMIVDPALAIMWCYLGLIPGDLGSGLLSQRWRSRRAPIALALVATAVLIAVACLVPLPAWGYYALAAGLGVAVGYWAVFVTVAAEQFGTNLRASVTTVVPNVARGLFPPCIMAVGALSSAGLGYPLATLAVGLACVALAGLGLALLRETWGTDLDWQER